MLASPLMPTSGFSEEQYRPAKDIEAFKSLLPPPIEFVEGSSSGALAIEEGKYQPINGTPKTPKVESLETRKGAYSTSTQSPKSSHPSTTSGKHLYTGNLDTAWPKGTVVGSGLHNTGNTCFLNSALQCLLHTPPLLHVLLVHTKGDPCRVPKGAFCMACSLRQVMVESHRKHHSFAPYPITTKLQVIAKHMRRGRQEDSHEFLRYAIDALQKSCLAGYPPKLDPKLAETTWVHKIFGGRLRSRVTCTECGHNSDTFDSVLDLSIDIYGVNGLKEALRKFVAVDHLKGADKYKCEKCKKPVAAEKQFTLHEAPLVLTMHLKRFSPMGRKISHPVKYDERLSLQPIMSSGQHGPTYSLYGVISHAGGGPNSGHYYAHVKGSDGQWYEMNDESVTRHHGAPTGMRNAYILFYIRDKGQVLEAAVKAVESPAAPPKTGLVASMKKRKIVDSDDEDNGRRSKSKTPAPFIGPQLPSPSPVAGSSTHDSKRQSSVNDPQAELLKKRIAAAARSPTSALQSLAQYDDDDDDMGEKIEEPKTNGDVRGTSPASSLMPSPSISTPAPPVQGTASTSLLSSSIPVSSFYGTKAKAKEGDSSKKRKSPDVDRDDDESLTEWARTPIAADTSSGLARDRKQSRFLNSGQNPYNRVKGSDNLRQRRDPSTPRLRYGKKKRFIV